jgi:hypothetical protein
MAKTEQKCPKMGIKLWESIYYFNEPIAEVGKVTLKSNGNKALSYESLLKSNGDEELNDDFS